MSALAWLITGLVIVWGATLGAFALITASAWRESRRVKRGTQRRHRAQPTQSHVRTVRRVFDAERDA